MFKHCNKGPESQLTWSSFNLIFSIDSRSGHLVHCRSRSLLLELFVVVSHRVPDDIKLFSSRETCASHVGLSSMTRKQTMTAHVQHLLQCISKLFTALDRTTPWQQRMIGKSPTVLIIAALKQCSAHGFQVIASSGRGDYSGYLVLMHAKNRRERVHMGCCESSH